MKRFRQKLNQSGDTIVEVLIAVTVVSSILVAAFAVTQSSSIAVRDGQERSELTQILQGQIEAVRALAQAQTTPTGGVFNTASSFCIAGLGTPTPAPAPLSHPDCDKNQGRYKISICYDSGCGASGNNTGVFVFKGEWPSMSGETNTAQYSYRVYPSLP